MLSSDVQARRILVALDVTNVTETLSSFHAPAWQERVSVNWAGETDETLEVRV